MEHVEPEYTEQVLEDIWKHARLGIHFYIPTTLACAILPDGRNAHINLKTPAEWIRLMEQYPRKEVLAKYNDRSISISIGLNNG